MSRSKDPSKYDQPGCKLKNTLLERERERGVLDFLPLAKPRRLSLRKSSAEEAEGFREGDPVRLGEWII